jgi:hypothetical protein
MTKGLLVKILYSGQDKSFRKIFEDILPAVDPNIIPVCVENYQAVVAEIEKQIQFSTGNERSFDLLISVPAFTSAESFQDAIMVCDLAMKQGIPCVIYSSLDRDCAMRVFESALPAFPSQHILSQRDLTPFKLVGAVLEIVGALPSRPPSFAGAGFRAGQWVGPFKAIEKSALDVR